MNLFKGVVKDLSSVNINWINDKSPIYVNGYRMAAEKLSIDYEKLQTQEKDSLIFPIIFLYRQHIELALKGIIRQLDVELGFNRKDKILVRHKLLKLWDEANDCYNNFIQKNSTTLVFTTSSVTKERAVVKCFNNIDEDSFSFRYSTDTKGNDNLKGINYISLNNFQMKILPVIDHIDKMIETLAHSIDMNK